MRQTQLTALGAGARFPTSRRTAAGSPSTTARPQRRGGATSSAPTDAAYGPDQRRQNERLHVVLARRPKDRVRKRPLLAGDAGGLGHARGRHLSGAAHTRATPKFQPPDWSPDG